MKKLFTVMIIVSVSIIITSCSSTVTRQIADHGPAPGDYKKAISSFLDRNLREPDSLQDFVILTEPRQGFLNYGLFKNGPTGKNFSNALWYVCVEYRAKNVDGAYTGSITAALFFYDNEVVNVSIGAVGGGDLGLTVYSCY